MPAGPPGRRRRRWFGGVLGAGFDAVVSARAPRMRWPKGQMRYNARHPARAAGLPPIPYVVELDGQRIETRAMLVAVANTTSFGGGMKVSPDADVDDGLFDVLIVHALSVAAFLRVFPSVYAGTHVDHPAVETPRARRVRLEAHGIHAQADGEPLAVLPLDVEVVPGALRVVVPAAAGTHRGRCPVIARGPGCRVRSGFDFPLDDFQVEACRAVEEGRGVLVAAPTGRGQDDRGRVRRAPGPRQRAQGVLHDADQGAVEPEVRRPGARHGVDRVGLLTGDASINGEAPIVVMTTEVLRNMMYSGSSTLRGLGGVVMDEVHYLADRFRGAVWEEVIIHLPLDVSVVSLSATVSNAEEFGAWLEAVRGDTAIIVSEHRPVPLWQHMMVGQTLFDLFVEEVDGRATAAPTTRAAAGPSLAPIRSASTPTSCTPSAAHEGRGAWDSHWVSTVAGNGRGGRDARPVRGRAAAGGGQGARGAAAADLGAQQGGDRAPQHGQRSGAGRRRRRPVASPAVVGPEAARPGPRSSSGSSVTACCPRSPSSSAGPAATPPSDSCSPAACA